MQGGWGRNWDELMRSYSSGEDSDEGDGPNVVSFQKNARRNAELIRQFVPHMNPEHADTLPPMLMKDPYTMHEDLVRSGFFSSHRSCEPPVEPASASVEPTGVRMEGEPPNVASEAVSPVEVASEEVAGPPVMEVVSQGADSQEVRQAQDPETHASEALEDEPSPGVLV